MRAKITLLLGVVIVLVISGCIQNEINNDGSNRNQTQQSAYCGDGICQLNEDCFFCTQDCGECELSVSDIQPCIFCEHITVDGDNVEINLNNLEEDSPVSVFFDAKNIDTRSLGKIKIYFTCWEPKYNLMPITLFRCWPGLEEGCHLNEANTSVTLEPQSKAMLGFFWDKTELQKLSKSSSLTCLVYIGSLETSKTYYAENITFNFIK